MTHPRLSHNQITTRGWPLADVVAGCVDAGIGAIGLWREPVAEVGLEAAARLVRAAGLQVSSLCRGGFFPTGDARAAAARQADNRAAVEEAAALGTDVLVLVCGGLPDGSRDLDGARAQVLEGIADLVPHAAAAGVRLAIEPLHPVFAADRSVVVTLAQALDMAERFPAEHVGVVVDTYHLWWDPEVWAQIDRAAGRILSFQVCDWLVPLPPDPLLGRGMPGDGVIDFGRFWAAVSAAGYDGPVEVELFNQEIWDTPGPQVLDRMVKAFDACVAPAGASAGVFSEAPGTDVRA